MEVEDSMDLSVTFPQNVLQYEKLSTFKKDLFQHDENKCKILDSILSTNIGEVNNIRLKQYVKTKSFYDFKIRHSSAKYSRFFRPKICKKSDHFEKYRVVKGKVVQHYIEKKKSQDEIHISEITDSFRTILYQIVSKELIGSDRNKRKIIRTFYRLLQTAKTEPFTLLGLIKQINISSITWIKDVENHQIKYLLVAKFIKWLFHYFIALIYHEFHVAYLKGKKVFILIEDWTKVKKHYIGKMNNKMALIPVDEIVSRDEVKNKQFLIPKRDGIRCITKHEYAEGEKQELRKVLSVLKYLHIETYLKNTDNNFDKKYLEVVKMSKSSSNKVFIVMTDICDAYGSIRPAKLFDIIQEMLEHLPDKLMLESNIVRRIKKYKVVNIDKNLMESEEAKRKKIEYVNKYNILCKIKNFIYNTQVIVENKVYNVCKGLPQGLMLSSTLCDIYYAHMRKKYFSIYEKEGYLFTYVDDSIYITENLDFAKQYLNRIMKGIPEYNCWYNKLKLKKNFGIDSDTNSIEYLGWEIEPNTLEVQPNYALPRYSTNFTNLNFFTLKYKLQWLTSLKLSKLVLCKEVNSEKRIFSNIKIIAEQQAKRCYTLMVCLNKKNSNMLLRLILSNNFKIVRKIGKLTDWSDDEITQKRKKILYIVWESFYCVFNKHKDIESFMYLCKVFKKLMKKYSCESNKLQTWKHCFYK